MPIIQYMGAEAPPGRRQALWDSYATAGHFGDMCKGEPESRASSGGADEHKGYGDFWDFGEGDSTTEGEGVREGERARTLPVRGGYGGLSVSGDIQPGERYGGQLSPNSHALLSVLHSLLLSHLSPSSPQVFIYECASGACVSCVCHARVDFQQHNPQITSKLRA
jgi:hypothetical protein